ncbi:MAG: SDR family NAD(P)-dependent oxidoreductase, partial [Muribaculaceae bacterium]|nr:SDR family NAD(P)-dependent oxidoreductase [Muribaculaceae bacterium]
MVAVVTGASGGIGLEFCKALAERNFDIVMISIDDEPLHVAATALAESYGVRTYPMTLNLFREDAPDRI